MYFGDKLLILDEPMTALSVKETSATCIQRLIGS